MSLSPVILPRLVRCSTLIACLPALRAAADASPVQKLDPVVVTAERVPLVKLDLGWHLRTARFGAAVVADGDYLYVVGGSNDADTPLDDIERVDTRTGAVDVFAHLANARRDHRVIVHGGKLYVLGGYNGIHFETTDFFEDSVEVVDLATRTVKRTVPMPIARANFACAQLGGRIYVIGGAARRIHAIVETNTMDIFDLATGQWRTGVPMPTPRMAHATAVGNFIVVAGGFGGGRERAEVEVFFPGENGWRSLPPLHQPVSANSLTFYDHYLFLFGAHELVSYELQAKQSEAYRFDYQAARNTATVVHRGRIYVVGGTLGGNLTTEDAVAGSYQTPQALSDVPRREPDERDAESAAVSFAQTDPINRQLSRVKDYTTIDDIQVFELRKVAR